ncbi:MAG: hypothetical protein JO266_09900 [Acidobacteria bacterium]|nr:hypothetical protein [Acidobacteriota bacterium]MBV9482275.1 hypothetical protein [Acidobacteriota bacterium]
MSDTDTKILDALERLENGQKAMQGDIANLKQGQQEQGKKLDDLHTKADVHDKKLDRLDDHVAHINPVLEILQGMIEETKEDIDEIKRRQRPQKVD